VATIIIIIMREKSVGVEREGKEREVEKDSSKSKN